MGEIHELKFKSFLYMKYRCFVVVSQGGGGEIGDRWLILPRSVKLYYKDTGKGYYK